LDSRFSFFDSRPRREERTLESVGVVALVIVGLGVVVGLAVFVRSIPDLARYRRLRRM
jgi:hypothetical protein